MYPLPLHHPFSLGEEMAKTDMAVASAAMLVAAQCVEAAELMGADRDHLASVVSSAVNVRSPGDIMTLTAAAATALCGAATLKARALKEVWNIAAVLSMEKGVAGGAKGSIGSSSSHSDELIPEENFLGICSRELLTRGFELLKRTRTGELHWKIVSVYINQMNQVATWSTHNAKVNMLLQFGDHILSVDVDGNMYIWAFKGIEHHLEPIDHIVLGGGFTPRCTMHPDTYLNKVVIGSEESSLQL